MVNVVLYFVWLFFPTSRFHLLSFSKDFKVENNVSINRFYYIFYSCHANKKSGVCFSFPVVVVISLYFFHCEPE